MRAGWLLLALACKDGGAGADDTGPAPPVDGDGDGLPVDDDCDDQDPEVGLPPTWYGDADGDGHGDVAAPSVACIAPEGTVASDQDCDDADPLTYPDAPETCEDGHDSDCDGLDEPCGFFGDVDLAASGSLAGGGEGDAGTILVGLGDLDQDGRPDIGAGVPALGTALVLSGAALVSGQDLSRATELVQGGTLLGSAMAPGGDLNGDGLPDLLLGDPDGAGTAWVVHGPLGEGDPADMGLALTGPEGALLGHSLAGPGDLNADGADDLVLGAPAENGAGTVYFLTGPITASAVEDQAHSAVYGEGNGNDLGWSLAAVGDLNGDGVQDTALGAPGTEGDLGAVYLWSDLPGGTESIVDGSGLWRGEFVLDRAGAVVAPAGDVNGDGLDDVLVSAPGKSTGQARAGQVYLLAGPATGARNLSTGLARLRGLDQDGAAGGSTHGAGDVDSDGFADVLVGATGGSGGAWLVRGPITGSMDLDAADAVFSGPEDAQLGASVLGPGDLTADGFDDVLVGAPGLGGFFWLRGGIP